MECKDNFYNPDRLYKAAKDGCYFKYIRRRVRDMEKTKLLLIVNAWNDLFDEVERQYMELDKELDYRSLSQYEIGLRVAYGDIMDRMREMEGDILK